MQGALPPEPVDLPAGTCTFGPGAPPPPPLPGRVDGPVIYVGMSDRFSPGTDVEAVGQPCLSRAPLSPTTIAGVIALNVAHPVESITRVRLRYLAVHELGHALGLVGAVSGSDPAWLDRETGRYTGAMALEGLRRAIPDPWSGGPPRPGSRECGGGESGVPRC